MFVGQDGPNFGECLVLDPPELANRVLEGTPITLSYGRELRRICAGHLHC